MCKSVNRKFVRDVDALIARTLRKEVARIPEKQRDVCAVAFGFVVLRQLIDAAMGTLKFGDPLVTELLLAADMVDALISGTAHPVHRYLNEAKGLRRLNRAPASKITEWRQGLIVGSMRTLQNDIATPMTRNKAAALLAKDISLDGIPLFTAKQITGWDERFTARDDVLPNAVREKIVQHFETHGPTTETVIQLAQRFAHVYWSTPVENS